MVANFCSQRPCLITKCVKKSFQRDCIILKCNEIKKTHFFSFPEASGVKAVILYMYDDSIVGSNVVSMEVDKRTFMNVIKDSQFAAMSAKPLKFGQDNGFFALLDGESSSFSFATAAGMADCDCKCSKKVIPTTTTPRPTTTTQRPTTTTRPIITTRPITQRPTTSKLIVNTPSRTTPGPTYLPPTPTYLPPTTLSAVSSPLRQSFFKFAKRFFLLSSAHQVVAVRWKIWHFKWQLKSVFSGPFCCLNGAANRDCCANGGQGSVVEIESSQRFIFYFQENTAAWMAQTILVVLPPLFQHPNRQ